MLPNQQHNPEDLTRAVEQHHEQYLRSLRSLNNGLGIRSRERADSRNTIPEISFTPPLRAFSGLALSIDSQAATPPRSTTAASLTRADALIKPSGSAVERPASFCPSPRPLSVSPDGFVPDEDLSFIPLLDSTSRSFSSPVPARDNVPRVTQPLCPMQFSDAMLLYHLREAELSDDMVRLLDEVVRRRPDIDLAVPFRDFASYEREGYVSATFEVYDVAADASATKTSLDTDVLGLVKYAGEGPYESPDGIVDAPTVWETIKDVNADGEAVGRITIVQEPTPLILAALHLTMSPHFDMSELLHHLLSDTSNRGRTHASMHRAFERPPSASSPSSLPSSPHSNLPLDTSFTHLRQRSFFFVFKYYTVVGEGLEPASWQRYDKRPFDKRMGDHIDIAECSSVLALSLGGPPTKPLRIRPRREKAREGFLFDTFGPWHLLSIQSFPDDQHTVRDDEFQRKSFYNGPYAFLDLLVAEYRDAGKRNQILHERITKLITPPTEFMFDPRLRDKLLFEDKHFTYIRRYFWAYNTLAVVNTGIKAMVAAYMDTFTDDFWAGAHPQLWPHPAPDSAEGLAYRDKMALLRRELDKVVAELGEVLKRNERTRKEIENLRDQLFSGSSIKESRRAIEQGDNVRILTMISMIFLPLTFVTSVYGMTEFTIPADDYRFALTMILVSVPFMVIIMLLQTRTFTVLLRKIGGVLAPLVALFRDQTDASETPPRRGRKRRLAAVDNGGTRWALWTGRWSWRRGGAEEVELGRV